MQELLVHAHDVHRALQRVDDAAVAVQQAVLHVAQSGIDEDTILVPASALDPDVLMERVVVLQVLARQHHVVLRHECDVLAVRRPGDVPHATGNGDVVDGLACRQVVHHDLLLTLQQEPVVPPRVDVVHSHGRVVDLLRQLILHVVDANGAAVLEDGEAVASRESDSFGTALHRGEVSVPSHLARADEQIIATVVLRVVHQDVGLGLVEGVKLQALHAVCHGVRGSAACGQLLAGRALVHVHNLHVTVLNNIQAAAVSHGHRTLAIQLEHHHACIVTNGEQVRVAIPGDDPEAVVFPAEGVDACSLSGVPHPDGAILGIGDDEVLLRVEHHARDVVEMTSQRVHLPSLGIIHPPEFDQPVVCTGDDQRQRRVEGGPIDASFVALKHVFHHSIRGAEHIA
mmetsp:Transcript_113163/g.359657  ORF Transcript_113163/g.359657 Transcript_113163/m.359657 type:complete len:399 (-) Transcript_113163:752-1948(-)